MTTSNPETASQNAVLQQAIDILKANGGSLGPAELYEQFSTVLGHTPDETEAANIYEILSTSSAASCLLQPDGSCLYVATADDQTFTLHDNKGETGTYPAGSAGMEEALSRRNNPQGFVPDGSHASQAVTEPSQLIDADSPAAKDQEHLADRVRDVKADAQAQIDAAEDALQPDRTDRSIDRLAGRIDRDDEKIRTEKARIEKHEEQIGHDRTSLMKDFHEAEIHHDERVIDRDEHRIHTLEEDILDK